VPCRRACGARLGDARVHGNGTHALDMLGGSMASGCHGRGAVHGRSRSGAARGIVHGGRRGAGGEVTTRGGVGAVLPKPGIHGGHGGVLGIGEVAGCVAGVWGRGKWSAGTTHAHWALAVVVVSKGIGREGSGRGDSLGLLLSLESN
jgi:hypothetical protein